MDGGKKASKKARIKSPDKSTNSSTADTAEAVESEMAGNHSDLRRRAEGMLLKEQGELDKISPVDQRNVVHELRVHQIELEMQNEELRRTQQELEASREKYFDLYDLAPAGYVSLSEKGIILEANLSMASLLERERSHLVGRPLTRFIHREDQDIYYLCHKQLIATRVPQMCELRMERKGGAPFWVRIDIVAKQNIDNSKGLLAIIIDISQRKRSDDDRKLAEEELQRVMNRLSIIEEKERKNLSEILHETLGHELALAKFKLSLFRQTASSPEVLKEIDELFGLIDQSIKHTRTLTFELSSPVFYELGLTAAIEWLCEHSQERHGMEVNFTPDKNLIRLDSETSILIYKSMRELLVNIVKHANAARVWITAETKDDNLIIDVEDDGIGFDVLKYQQNRSSADCFGIFSVSERMRYLGGTFEMKSRPGHGTMVSLKVPLADKRKS